MPAGGGAVTRKSKRMANPVYGLLPADVAGFDTLAELALDMRWSWNHATDEVWKQLDPVLWELTHNPWAVLQTVSRDRIEASSRDPVFRKRVATLCGMRFWKRATWERASARLPALLSAAQCKT